jgi:hypothetical protein
MNRLKLSLIFCLLWCSINLKAQNANAPLFVTQNGATNVVVIAQSVEATLAKIAAKYNVSQELLAVFNNKKTSDVFPENEEIIIPLVETNYIKKQNKSDNQNTYLGLYHQASANQELKELCRLYLVSASNILEWNQLKPNSNITGTNLLIGWLKVSAKDEMNTKALNDIKTSSKKITTSINSGINSVTKSMKDATNKLNINNLINTDSIAYDVTDEDTISRVSQPLVQLLTQDIFNEENKKLLASSGDKLKKSYAKVKGSIKNVIESEKDKNYEAKQKAIQAQKDKALLQETNTSLKKELDEKNNSTAVEINQKDNKEIITSEKTESIYDLAKNHNDEEKNDSENLSTEPDRNAKNNSNEKLTKHSNKLSGNAAWFYVGSTGGTFYVFTNYAPKGSIISIFNPVIKASIIATVLGPLTNEEIKSGQIALISDNAKADLKCDTQDFQVELDR